MISMWKEALILLGILALIEIGYRVVDYLVFKANNIPGEMDCEE